MGCVCLNGKNETELDDNKMQEISKPLSDYYYKL